MKPRKKQRIDHQDISNEKTVKRKREGTKEKKKNNIISNESDEYAEVEKIDVEDEDDEKLKFEGVAMYSKKANFKLDELDLEVADDSEESDQDDFQDIKSKSTPKFLIFVNFRKEETAAKRPSILRNGNVCH